MTDAKYSQDWIEDKGMTDYTREKTDRQVRLNRMINRASRTLTKKLRKFGYMGNLSVCYTPNPPGATK